MRAGWSLPVLPFILGGEKVLCVEINYCKLKAYRLFFLSPTSLRATGPTPKFNRSLPILALISLMSSREKLINVYLLVMAPFALAAAGVSIYTFPVDRVDLGLLAIGVVTIFVGSVLRIQLPRNNIHLTISDALLILTMLIYGAQPALVIAVLEGANTSLSFKRKGVPVKTRTILMNMMIAAIAVDAAARAVEFVTGQALTAARHTDFTGLAGLMLGISLSLFLVNTICLGPFLAIKSDKSIFKVWSEYCFDALVMYLISGLMAGLMLKALEQINIYMFAIVIGVFGLIYWTYRRNIDDVKRTSEEAQDAERLRAEQAEAHVEELEHYVGELERTGQALKESRQRFRHAAYHDPLTGLPNRNRFVDGISEQLDAGNTSFALLFLDLDNFRAVNESLGYSVGDKLLIAICERIGEIIGGDQLFGRFGGDEFAILTASPGDKISAENLAHRVVASFEQPFYVDGRRVFAHASIGIAFGNDEYARAEEVIRDADIAMYFAKDRKAPFVVFTKEMHEKAVKRLELATDLRIATEKKEFQLFYQPIVRIEDRSLYGFEALMRWNHPTRGLVSPGEFIPLAESTGLIVPMTVDILRSGCEQMVNWQREMPSVHNLMLSVNLSAIHLADANVVDHIDTVIKETDIRPSSLKLEITESSVLENADHTIDVLNRIKDLGVRLSIDDFGTGYSSLSYLHRFPVDTLKIDRSFVSTMENGSESEEIVRIVVTLAKALNLSVIAEGIENPYQLRQLQMLGCEFAQGYLFSRPVSASDAVSLLDGDDAWLKIELPHDGFVPLFTPMISSHKAAGLIGPFQS